MEKCEVAVVGIVGIVSVVSFLAYLVHKEGSGMVTQKEIEDVKLPDSRQLLDSRLKS